MNNRAIISFRLLAAVTFLIIAVGPGASCLAQEKMEEFNGPFASWANVKTRFGAKGDGRTDDTKCFQRALDSLSDYTQQFNMSSKGYSVVYIPRGTYKMTATLVLRGKMGIRIVGEDPVNTTLLWQGNDDDTMFWANGSAYFSLSRLSWDAGGRKNMEAIGMHWKSIWSEPNNRSYAPEQIEFTDHIFKSGFARGIHGGTYGGKDGTGMNESEVTIKRCVFNGCGETGILIRGFNALDYWIWHCQFIKCRIGVTSSSGNYNIYKSYFSQSELSDVYNINSYYTSVRYCYSSGSSAFSKEDGGSSNPFKRIFEGNVVTGIKTIGILYTHTGKITLLDNVFSTFADRSFLKFDNSTPSMHYDIMDFNNSFSGFSNIYEVKGQYHIFKDDSRQLKVRSRVNADEDQFLKALSVIPSYHRRIIFDVPVNSSSFQIQDIINKASALKQRAIIHFPFGIYNMVKPLTIPVNSDVQIEGDGQLYASILQKAASQNFENGAALKIFCPATVSIKNIDFELTGNGSDNGRAIALIGADQKGATVLIDQFYADNDTSLLVKNYDYTLVQKTNSFFTAGNYVSGGKQIQAGNGTMKVQSFGSQFANTTLEQNATFVARDCWWEGATSIPVNLKGSGNFIVDGAMIAPRKLDSSVIVAIGNYTGKVVLLDMYLIGSIIIKADNPSLQFLGWNLNFYHKKRPLAFIKGNESYKGFFSGIGTQCFNTKDPDCSSMIPSADQAINISKPEKFMDEMTRELRAALPIEYTAKPPGITNIYMSRVSVATKYKTGIAFTK